MEQLRKLYRRTSGNLYQALIPDLVFYFTYWRHTEISILRCAKANAG
jgi:hypothetical protein